MAGLLYAARRRTGLDDFGDDWFIEPLTVLTTSLVEQARLSPLGLELTRRRLTALLGDRLRARELRRRHPEIAELDVPVAAVICGLPRTGSTLLHRLLAASPRLTAPLSWETSYPVPFPGEGRDAEERKRRARERAAVFLEMSPDFGDIHTIEWDGPEEDVILLDRTFTSMSFDSFYWVPTYGDWLRQVDQAPAYAELREWLQLLQWQDPARAGRAWVLKSPHHLMATDTVLDTFPGCRIVMTHRSPVAAVPSYASMVVSMSRQYSDEVDPHAVGPYWADRFATTLRGFVESRDRRQDRFVDVRFTDLVTDPIERTMALLGELGLPADEHDRAAFTDYRERNRAQRHGTHTYTSADFGLSDDGLARDFAYYQEGTP
ncbi:sulfotransferase family protein [Actinophytocola sediminis]